MEVSKVTKLKICEILSRKDDVDQLSQSTGQIIEQLELLNSNASAGETEDVVPGYTGTLVRLLEGKHVRFTFSYTDTR